jgi:hypothetical protein
MLPLADEVRTALLAGWDSYDLARMFGCTEADIWNIRAQHERRLAARAA